MNRCRKLSGVGKVSALGILVLVIVQPVGVVVVGILLGVRESGEPVSALGAGVVERLVPDELTRIGLRLAVAPAAGHASCMVLLLEMDDIVVPNPDGKVAGPQHGSLVLEVTWLG